MAQHTFAHLLHMNILTGILFSGLNYFVISTVLISLDLYMDEFNFHASNFRWVTMAMEFLGLRCTELFCSVLNGFWHRTQIRVGHHSASNFFSIVPNHLELSVTEVLNVWRLVGLILNYSLQPSKAQHI